MKNITLLGFVMFILMIGMSMSTVKAVDRCSLHLSLPSSTNPYLIHDCNPPDTTCHGILDSACASNCLDTYNADCNAAYDKAAADYTSNYQSWQTCVGSTLSEWLSCVADINNPCGMCYLSFGKRVDLCTAAFNGSNATISDNFNASIESAGNGYIYCMENCCHLQ